MLLRALFQFTAIHRLLVCAGNRGGRGEFRDQQFWIVDLRHHQDFREPGGDRRLRAARSAIPATTLAPLQLTSKRTGKPATERSTQS